jgi:membrane protease YdiL (CAAX protease family)
MTGTEEEVDSPRGVDRERDAATGPWIAGRRVSGAEVLERLLLVARGLGFVVLVFFLPDVARRIAARELPGGGFAGLLQSHPDGPLAPLLTLAASVLLSGLIVTLHARLGRGADRPRPLLRPDRHWALEWGRGFLLGGGLASAAVIPLWGAGLVRIRGLSESCLVTTGGLGPLEAVGFAGAILVALALRAAQEEMGFRGPSLRDLTGGVGAPLGAFFLAASFAIIHGRNPALGRAGLLGIFLAGFALAGIVRARGDLGMACGIHFGWNAFLGLVWSMPVSGYLLSGRLLVVEPSPSSDVALWTGGDFGVEGGVTGIAVLFLFGFFAWRLPAASGRAVEGISGNRGGASADAGSPDGSPSP